MKVRRRFRFEAAHRLPEHPGKCRELHGHSYELVVNMEGPIEEPSGMVIDFSDLKQIVRERVVQRLDHRNVNDIIENGSYHRLLLMYKGESAVEELLGEAEAAGGLENATLGYGIGNWHYYNGRPKQAEAVYRTILQGSQWAAFGYIAAEADIARLSE